MDWNNVSWWQVCSALREADWRQRPQPVFEFLQPNRFSLPKTRTKWSARAKNNVFYYRANYALILSVLLIAVSIRQPQAAAAVALATFAAATLHDPFIRALSTVASTAVTFMMKRSRLAWRLPRGFTAPAAAPTTSLRQPLPGSGGESRPGRVRRFMRRMISAAITVLALYIMFRARAVVRLTTGLAAGAAIVSVHATLRSPNLKARIGSERDEFRALWRGYQEIDYTL